MNSITNSTYIPDFLSWRPSPTSQISILEERFAYFFIILLLFRFFIFRHLFVKYNLRTFSNNSSTSSTGGQNGSSSSADEQIVLTSPTDKHYGREHE